MQSDNLVSIIIPTFNRREYLQLAVDSALHQTWEAIEVIVVDDGSTDGTMQMLSAIAQTEPKLRFASQSNKGPAAARNLGLSLAMGRYVTFLDSDDELHADACGILVETQLKYRTALVVGSRGYMSPEGKKYSAVRIPQNGPIADPIEQFFRLRIPPQIACWLFPLELVRHVRFDESLHAREDMDLLSRILLRGLSVSGATEAMYHQRFHNQGRQMHRQFEPEILQGVVRAYAEHARIIRSEKMSRPIRRAFAQSLSRTSLRLWGESKAQSLQVYRIARSVFVFPELLALPSYPAGRIKRAFGYVAWLVGGPVVCGPLWIIAGRLKGQLGRIAGS